VSGADLEKMLVVGYSSTLHNTMCTGSSPSLGTTPGNPVPHPDPTSTRQAACLWWSTTIALGTRSPCSLPSPPPTHPPPLGPLTVDAGAAPAPALQPHPHPSCQQLTVDAGAADEVDALLLKLGVALVVVGDVLAAAQRGVGAWGRAERGGGWGGREGGGLERGAG
jgi:hypothetical protein